MSGTSLRGIEALKRKLEDAKQNDKRKVMLQTTISIVKLQQVITFAESIGVDSESVLLKMGLEKLITR